MLGGDFNYARLGGLEPEHQEAANRLGAALGLVDPAVRTDTVPPATWPSPGTPSVWLPPQRFDLFYVTRDLLPRLLSVEVFPWGLAESGSDHLPLVLDLRD